MRATIFPSTGVQFKPAFWGVDRDLAAVVDEMDSIWGGQVPSATMAQADFRETDTAYFVSMDMPGVSKKDLSLEIEEERILVNAMRKRALAGQGENSQKVARVITLPQNVDRDKVQAHLEDGVLYLAMPKEEKAKPKKIELNDSPIGELWPKTLAEKVN